MIDIFNNTHNYVHGPGSHGAMHTGPGSHGAIHSPWLTQSYEHGPWLTCVAVQQPWRTGYTWKGGWKWKRMGGQEKDEAKTKVSDQGSKFNFQLCVYIGKNPTDPFFVSARLCCFVSTGQCYKTSSTGSLLLQETAGVVRQKTST